MNPLPADQVIIQSSEKKHIGLFWKIKFHPFYRFLLKETKQEEIRLEPYYSL
jgi:hypothetical protein